MGRQLRSRCSFSSLVVSGVGPCLGPAAVLVTVCGLLPNWPLSWEPATPADPPVAAVPQAHEDVVHPLDPLSVGEIRAATLALEQAGKVGEGTRYALVELKEPDKAELRRWAAGEAPAPRREARCVLSPRPAGPTAVAVIDVSDAEPGPRHRQPGRLLSYTEEPGARPGILQRDIAQASRIAFSDPGFVAALRARGIPQPEQQVVAMVTSAGYHGLPEDRGGLALRVLPYLREGGGEPFTRPIEGLTAYVDLAAGRVIALTDVPGTRGLPRPGEPGDFRPEALGPLRPAPPPLQVVQPQGRGFTLRGQEVRWQKWRLRWALHPREGLVLYAVGYEDEGRVRPVLYRGSVSEMVVPYGDPGPAWFFRASFDEGELGLGNSAVPLQPGLDAPDNAVLLDAVLADEHGQPLRRSRQVAIYERDGGVLWRHSGGGHDESRRARELVLFSVATVGNYDYGFAWVLHQDGTLEAEVQLTGVMAVKGVAAQPPLIDHGHGHQVAPGLVAVHHQHFFNYRLDLDVDGPDNRLVEMDLAGVPPGPDNPHGNAFVMRERRLAREDEARRMIDVAASRKWRVESASATNALGQPTGYTLVPGENAVAAAAPGSPIRRRAGFLDAHLWATRYDPRERFAAGEFINQDRGGGGLPAWTRARRSIDGQDLVLWYTVGVTHTPRPEEWPVMSVHRAGFLLVPTGFFARNPALDVPRP